MPEQACITSYFRHISEAFVPTYTSIFIALGITEGRVSAGTFIFSYAAYGSGTFCCRLDLLSTPVPKDTGMVPDQPKGYYWKLLVQSIWAIALTIALILIFNLPVWGAVWICILLNVFVNHFNGKELVPFIRTAFEARLLLSTLLIMIFKELLTETGVITHCRSFSLRCRTPTFLVFVLLFLFGTIVAGTQATLYYVCLCREVITPGHTGLALFTLLMCIGYVAMQISPTHICLILCSEDYKVSLGSMIRRTIRWLLYLH